MYCTLTGENVNLKANTFIIYMYVMLVNSGLSKLSLNQAIGLYLYKLSPDK